MKRKKGFTIIDFLALIGVVAILLAIASPFVIKTMKNNEKEQLIKKTEELIKAAKKITPEEELTIKILDHEYASADNLIINKDLPLAATIKINTSNQISIVSQDKNWCIKKDYDETDYTISKFNGNCAISNSVSFAGINVDIKENESGKDGLYLDDETSDINKNLPYASKYYYKGSQPNNYIVLSKKCYRIVNITQNDSLKIIYEGTADSKGTCDKVSTSSSGDIGKIAWNDNTIDNEAGINNWYDDGTTLRSFLDEANNTLILKGSSKTLTLQENKDNIVKGTYYVGALNYDKYTKQSLAVNMEQEKTNKNNIMPIKDIYDYNSIFGLINISDYVKASASNECKNAADAMNKSSLCSHNNYLYKAKYNWWTLNASQDDNYVWTINKEGVLIKTKAANADAHIRPVLYLNKNLKLEGTGMSTNPYKIIEKKEEVKEEIKTEE